MPPMPGRNKNSAMPGQRELRFHEGRRVLINVSRYLSLGQPLRPRRCRFESFQARSLKATRHP
jgi:hypothetical protein